MNTTLTQDSRFKNSMHQSTLLHDEIVALIDKLGPKKNRDLIFQLLSVCVNFADEETDRLDIKIASSALAELSNAFSTFRAYRNQHKLTIFGSARTTKDDADYRAAHDLAQAMVENGWMIITGAGPGIMEAGIEGAGRENSFGVNIKLPFEGGANLFIAQDPKLVEMKYFFTRKLIFMKESHAFLILPGGFGTLDEAFELLTLVQTGKSPLAPIVFYEAKGGNYWNHWLDYVNKQLFERGMVSPQDSALYLITDSHEKAVDEIVSFYRNYHSMRWVGNLLILRMRSAPSKSEMKAINRDFGHICQSGTIESIPITGTEKGEKDGLDLARVALRFDKSSHGELRKLVNALNGLSSLEINLPIQTR
ncbi:LOG family protein [Acidithrix ferrooxidans]|uniref:LOG family protein n=1 Tax=Acidithrix ferrooxidans TaxID=1280514 RepID=UPI00126988D6|nr:TIGR00730 family Rossman fold protein [Acidithrix ferrooxidans]